MTDEGCLASYPSVCPGPICEAEIPQPGRSPRPAALKDQIAHCPSVPKSIKINHLPLAYRFGGPRIDESKPLTLSGSRPRIARKSAWMTVNT